MKRLYFPLVLMSFLLSACQTAVPVSPTTVPSQPTATVEKLALSTKPTEPTVAPPTAAPTSTNAPQPTSTTVSKSAAVPCATDCAWKITKQPKLLGGPSIVLIDKQGNLVVADANTYSVLKFDPNGNLLAKWGSYGKDNGQFGVGMYMTLDKDDNVYIADMGNARVQKFDPNGKFLMKFGTYGSSDGQFYNPTGLAVDSEGNIYVGNMLFAEPIESRPTLKFDSTGKYVGKWGNPGDTPFKFVSEIKIDAQGMFYVSDYMNNRVLKMDAQGKVLVTYDTCSVKKELTAQLRPAGVALDASGNVHVMDLDSNRICIFAPDGKFLKTWGKKGDGDGDIIYPNSAVFDSQGNLYIADGVSLMRSIDGRLRQFNKPLK